jgi:hypothetical protein
MSIPGSVNPLFLGAAGQATGGGEYQIERSVRFNSPDSAYLSMNSDPNLFASNNRRDTSANYQFGFYSRVGGTSQLVVITDAVLRDQRLVSLRHQC